MHYKCLNKHVLPSHPSPDEAEIIELLAEVADTVNTILRALDDFFAGQVKNEDVAGPYSVYTPYRHMLKNPRKSLEYATQHFLNQLGSLDSQRALNTNAFLAYAYCAGSTRAAEVGFVVEAWQSACEAKYWFGVLHGSIHLAKYGNHSAAMAPRQSGSSGGKAKSENYEPLRELARDLAEKGNYHSKRQAAIKIGPVILEESQRLKINMSPNQVVETLQRTWLKDMAFGRKPRT